MFKKMKLGENKIVSGAAEFRDEESEFTMQEGERIAVTNQAGGELDFYVQKVWWIDNMVLIGTKNPVLYSPPEPSTHQKESVLSSFEQRGQIYTALNIVTAALMDNEFRGKGGLRFKPGDAVMVTDPSGKQDRLRVFKILSGMPILISPEKYKPDIGLLDRLHFAWQIFTGKWFEK